MAVNLIQHIELRGDNPSKAVILGTNLKAYLVAQFALGWGVDAAIEQYGLGHAKIYAAMSFYYDNLSELREQFVQSQAQQKENAADARAKTEDFKTSFGQ